MKATTTATRPNLKRAISPVMELLEGRMLMSGSVTMPNDYTLNVVGTAASDDITIDEEDIFYSDGDAYTRIWYVTMNGKTTSFETPFITKVNVTGQGGNDKIEIDELETGCQVNVSTGSGNDSLKVVQQEGGSINFSAGGGTNAIDWEAPDFFTKWGQTDWVLSTGKIQYSSINRLTYTGVQNISFTGSFRDDTIAVKSVAAGTNVYVNGQQGNDTITVGNGKVASNIFGHLTLDGGAYYAKYNMKGIDTVIFDDTASFGGIETFGYNSFSKNGLASPIIWTGVDFLTLNASNGLDIVNIDTANTTGLTVHANGGNDVINVGGASGKGNLQFVQLTALTLDGGAGQDVIMANDAYESGPNSYYLTANSFKAGSKKSWSFSNVEGFTLFGGSGDNTVKAYAATANLLYRGQDGQDMVFGGLGDDTVYGGAGNDTIYTGDGRDFIDGGTGSDYMSGGNGYDTISYATRTASVKVNLGKQTGNGETGENDNIFADCEILEGGAGNDTLTLRNGEYGEIFGNAGNDTLIGGDMDDYLYGGVGNDLIKGNGGSDWIEGQAGTDSLSGGAGDDWIIADEGTKDYLDGGTGINTFYKDNVDVFKTIN